MDPPAYVIPPSIQYARVDEQGRRVRVMTWYGWLSGRIHTVTIDEATQLVVDSYVGPPAFELHDVNVLLARLVVLLAFLFLFARVAIWRNEGRWSVRNGN